LKVARTLFAGITHVVALGGAIVPRSQSVVPMITESDPAARMSSWTARMPSLASGTGSVAIASALPSKTT